MFWSVVCRYFCCFGQLLIDIFYWCYLQVIMLDRLLQLCIFTTLYLKVLKDFDWKTISLKFWLLSSNSGLKKKQMFCWLNFHDLICIVFEEKCIMNLLWRFLIQYFCTQSLFFQNIFKMKVQAIVLTVRLLLSFW